MEKRVDQQTPQRDREPLAKSMTKSIDEGQRNRIEMARDEGSDAPAFAREAARTDDAIRAGVIWA